MTFRKTSVTAFLMAASICIPALGQSRLWNGTWTLDSDSQASRPTVSFLQKDDGTYELVSSETISRFRCDAKPYPMLSRAGIPGVGDAICNSLSNSSLDITFQRKDKRPTFGRLRLSTDGKSLVFTLEWTDPSGKKQVKVRNYSRLSGSGGLAGDWKDVDTNPSSVLKVDLSAHAIILEYPLSHDIITLPLSGAETHGVVNGVQSKTAQALQIDSPTSFRLVISEGGVAFERASLSLSSDGNVVTELFWLEKHPEEVTKYTYHRSH